MANTEVGSAYISIYANLSNKFGSQIDSAVNSASAKFASLAKAAGAVAVAAGTAAAAGAIAIGKQALDAYASYEQLAGGVDKLYGSASEKLKQYAQEAYATAGMSANQYMEQATSFSAALVSSLGGDVDKAAEMTDVAMRAMSDNVNVFGSNMEDVQNAFQGFAKQNYTMLDNLKLGYGGTQAEMQRLIDDANAYAEANGKAADLSIDSFADIVQAIQYVQEAQGIAGTTAKEAATTIEGSIAMTKAAWQNLLTEMGKEDGDIPARMQELVDSATAVIENVTPVVGRIASALVAAAPELIPAAMELGRTLLQGIIDGLLEAFPQLDAIMNSDAMKGVAESFAPMMDSLQRIGEELAPMVGPAMEELGQTFVNNVIPALERLGEAASYFFEQLEPWAPHIMNVLVFALELFIVTISAVIDLIAACANIFGTVLEAGTAFCNFVEGIPDAIQGAIDTVGQWFADMDQKICDALDSAGQTVEGWKQDVSDWFTQLDEDINEKFESMKQAVGDWATETGAKAKQGGEDFCSNVKSKFDEAMAFIQGIPQQVSSFLSSLPATMGLSGSSGMTALYDGLLAAWNWVTSFVTSIPTNISNMLGNLGDLLWGAGWNILMGFYNGMVDAWNQMTGWISGLGSWIQNNKGPLEYDRNLLVENGKAIMEGLNEGMSIGFGDVQALVGGMGVDITASMSAGLASSDGNSLASEIRALRQDVRNLKLAVNIDGKSTAGALYPYIDRMMYRDAAREGAM